VLSVADVINLPLPVTNSWDWQQRASCRGLDASMFFHPENERGRSRRQREEQAKSICRHCPVRAECLSSALAVREAYGVWGGLSSTEREELLVANGYNGFAETSART
jgi:WhiB family redox-sensing transcriptional regulator